MKTILFAMLQVILASGILYGYYHLMLRNKRFHQYNRFYLLAAVIISLLIPFLNIPVYFTGDDSGQTYVLQTLRVINPPEFEESATPFIVEEIQPAAVSWFKWQYVAYAFYLFAVLAFLFRIILSVIKIKIISSTYPSEKIGNINFVNTNEPGTPFSFFRWLFWNRNIELDSDNGQQIFRHELFHINQGHSVDIVFMETITAFAWFNPFFYLFKNELNATHEFLADEFVMNKTGNWEYAELLLMQVLNTRHQLVNPFFHNQIKRRIAMITNPEKTSHRYLRKLLVLPVAAVVFILFAFSYKHKSVNKANDVHEAITDTIPGLSKIIKEITPSDSSHPLLVIDGKAQQGLTISKLEEKVSVNDIESINVLKGSSAIAGYGNKGKNGVIEIITKKALPVSIKEVTLSDIKSENDNKVFEKVEIEPAFPGGEAAWRKYLERNLNSLIPIQNHAPQGSYTVYIQFVVRKDGSIVDARPLTKHGFGMEDDVVKLIKTSPSWSPAIQNGRPVNAYKTQPVTFVVDEGKIPFGSEIKDVKNPLREVVMVGYNNNLVYEKVEIEPAFPGGEVAWKKYLERNLNSSVAAEKNAPPGEYTVYIQFIVHTDGYISDARPLTNHGFGMEQEAMRMIKKGPGWVPAVKNGKNVDAYKKQRIDFVVNKSKSETPANIKELAENWKLPTDRQWELASKTPDISIDELKKSGVHKLLQVPDEAEILSYNFLIESKNGDVINISNTGDKFNLPTIERIKNIDPPKTIIFERILVKKDGAEKKMAAKTYRVVN